MADTSQPQPPPPPPLAAALASSASTAVTSLSTPVVPLASSSSSVHSAATTGGAVGIPSGAASAPGSPSAVSAMPPIGGSTPAQAQAQLLLPPLVVRNLSDKVYDRRKLAALEVERIVRSIVDAHHITAAAAAAASAPLTASSAAGGVPLAPVAALISYLTAEFLSTPSTNLRNGGLIALAAVAIALGPEQLPTHLPLLIPPVLACFSDMDSRVRYYACESLYNIAKVARGRVLWAFPAIFDVLAKLVADTDMSVKSGAELLDRLLKDVITEQKTTWPAAVVAATPGGDNGGTVAARPAPLFSIPEFVRLLAARIRTLNPHTRSFLVAWLGVLDTVPGIDLVAHLPVYLPGLIVFLADESDDVRLATANLLAELLRDISEAVEAQRRNNAVLVPASGQGGGAAGALGPGGQWSPSFLTRLDFPLTFSLLLPFLDPTAAPPPTPPLLDPASPYYGTAAPPGAASTAAAAAATAAAPYPVPPAVARSLDVRTTCLQWTNEFILLAKRDMLVYAAAILRAILPMLADPDMGIASTAATTNSLLFTAVAEWGPAQPSPTPPGAPSTSPSTAPATLGAGTATLDIPRLLGAVLALTTHPSEATRLACLDWMLMVQKKAVAASTSQPTAPGGSPDPSSAPALLPAAFALLSDPSEDVVRRALQLVAQVSAAAEHRAQFDALMAEILTLFARDRRLLEQRGALIVRQLCLALPPEDVMRGFAGGLEREDDLEFASTMVTNLNLILITSAELSEMRKRLRAFDRDGQYLFVDLYRSWSHSAVATFSLCLLAQAYEHGFALLQLFEELEITVNLLVQIDKLVQLLESPVFTYLRLQLLEPDKHPYLFKCLYGLLMLLPQSSAFATLRNRLTCVSTLGYMHVVPRSAPDIPEKSKFHLLRRTYSNEIKWSELLTHFKSAQIAHERARKALVSATRFGSQRIRGPALGLAAMLPPLPPQAAGGHMSYMESSGVAAAAAASVGLGIENRSGSGSGNGGGTIVDWRRRRMSGPGGGSNNGGGGGGAGAPTTGGSGTLSAGASPPGIRRSGSGGTAKRG